MAPGSTSIVKDLSVFPLYKPLLSGVYSSAIKIHSKLKFGIQTFSLEVKIFTDFQESFIKFYQSYMNETKNQKFT